MAAATLAGRVCLVTGGTSGIGKATALGLAELGANVIVVCRDLQKGEAVRGEIEAVTGSGSIDVLVTDLSSQDSIHNLADEVAGKYDTLHVLINNAGVYYTRRRATPEGLEMTFAVNYLAPFLLTNLLLDKLKASAPARVINVSGAYHRKGTIDFTDLQGKRHYDGMRANAQSKLAMVLFTYELARRLADTGVTANCLHPGAVATPLVEKDEDYPGLLKLLYRLSKPFLKSPAQGAATSLYLASSPEVAEVTGRYFVNNRPKQSSGRSHDQGLAQRLWQVSEELTQTGGP
jgi:NAD(P)-dependent dehydrogenase (short-subunit alcohol dehydrogenase family)